MTAFDCRAPRLTAAAGAEYSRWRERSATGRRLVDEAGPLGRLDLGLGTRCHGLALSMGLAVARGRRDYDGLSNRGTAIRTSTHLVEQGLAMEVAAPIDPLGTVSLRMQALQFDRTIASAGPVLGYPERLRFWLADAGVRAPLLQLPSWGLDVEARLGGGPGGRMQLWLPTADPVSLPLGRSALAELALHLTPGPRQAGWDWRARLRWQWHDIGAGEARALTRHGVVVGGAAQPHTRRTSLALQFEVVAWP